MKKEYDFNKAKRVDPNRVIKDPKIMISIRIDPNVVAQLRDEADALGIGYQTLISNILLKHVGPVDESYEEKFIKRIMTRLEEAGVPFNQKKSRSKKKKTA